MRVFMLGWEFPPFISGGLGTACYGLTKALSAQGTDVTFVLPRAVGAPVSSHVRVVAPQLASYDSVASHAPALAMSDFEHVTFRSVDARLDPYTNPDDYQEVIESMHNRQARDASVILPDPPPPLPAPADAAPGRATGRTADGGNDYAGDLFGEVQRYAGLAADLATAEAFDVIHAHDWMTFPAAMAVAAQSGRPLIAHVHSTEFDRSGVHVDQRIYDIERRGLHAAIRVICVSHFTKKLIEEHYGISPAKIDVVYNAVEVNGNGHFDPDKYAIHKNEKIVLFLGRITQQKGPEYFLAAAKKVLEVMDNVKFVMAGSGDMIRRTIEMAASMGIGHKVLFTGFLRGGDIEKVFKMADLYVMPSVSEPFGIAPLEAISHDVPVLISKQSGVAEVLQHALKVDFWDVNEMANKIIAVLRHPPLSHTLREHGQFEVRKMSWTESARQCAAVYQTAVDGLA